MHRMRRDMRKDWLAVCLEEQAQGRNDPLQYIHLCVIPTYTEPYHVLERTVQAIVDANYPPELKMIAVMRGQTVVAGKVTLENHEAEWRFTPETPWQPGDYRLAIDTGIEDLAGNHIGAAFDIDIFDKVSKTIDRKSVTVPFAIR